MNYSTTTEQRQAISKEEIMSLPDLHGYWKHGDVVVPFRLPLANVKIVARGYIARELTPKGIDLKPLHHNKRDEIIARAPQPPPDIKRHEHALAEHAIKIDSELVTLTEYGADQVQTTEVQTSDLSRANMAENDVDEFIYQQD